MKRFELVLRDGIIVEECIEEYVEDQTSRFDKFSFSDEPTKKEWKEIEEWENRIREPVGCGGTGLYWKGPGYREELFDLCTGCKDCRGKRKEAKAKAMKIIADTKEAISVSQKIRK